MGSLSRAFILVIIVLSRKDKKGNIVEETRNICVMENKLVYNPPGRAGYHDTSDLAELRDTTH